MGKVPRLPSPSPPGVASGVPLMSARAFSNQQNKKRPHEDYLYGITDLPVPRKQSAVGGEVVDKENPRLLPEPKNNSKPSSEASISKKDMKSNTKVTLKTTTTIPLCLSQAPLAPRPRKRVFSPVQFEQGDLDDLMMPCGLPDIPADGDEMPSERKNSAEDSATPQAVIITNTCTQTHNTLQHSICAATNNGVATNKVHLIFAVDFASSMKTNDVKSQNGGKIARSQATFNCIKDLLSEQLQRLQTVGNQDSHVVVSILIFNWGYSHTLLERVPITSNNLFQNLENACQFIRPYGKKAYAWGMEAAKRMASLGGGTEAIVESAPHLKGESSGKINEKIVLVLVSDGRPADLCNDPPTSATEAMQSTFKFQKKKLLPAVGHHIEEMQQEHGDRFDFHLLCLHEQGKPWMEYLANRYNGTFHSPDRASILDAKAPSQQDQAMSMIYGAPSHFVGCENTDPLRCNESSSTTINSVYKEKGDTMVTNSKSGQDLSKNQGQGTPQQQPDKKQDVASIQIFSKPLGHVHVKQEEDQPSTNAAASAPEQGRGMGRGMGRTLPAWMTRGDQSSSLADRFSVTREDIGSELRLTNQSTTIDASGVLLHLKDKENEAPTVDRASMNQSVKLKEEEPPSSVDKPSKCVQVPQPLPQQPQQRGYNLVDTRPSYQQHQQQQPQQHQKPHQNDYTIKKRPVRDVDSNGSGNYNHNQHRQPKRLRWEPPQPKQKQQQKETGPPTSAASAASAVQDRPSKNGSAFDNAARHGMGRGRGATLPAWMTRRT